MGEETYSVIVYGFKDRKSFIIWKSTKEYETKEEAISDARKCRKGYDNKITYAIFSHLVNSGITKLLSINEI